MTPALVRAWLEVPVPLQWGADPTLVSHAGRTPLALSESDGNDRTSALLRAYA